MVFNLSLIYLLPPSMYLQKYIFFSIDLIYIISLLIYLEKLFYWDLSGTSGYSDTREDYFLV